MFIFDGVDGKLDVELDMGDPCRTHSSMYCEFPESRDGSWITAEPKEWAVGVTTGEKHPRDNTGEGWVMVKAKWSRSCV
jgi:hypothetical protein